MKLGPVLSYATRDYTKSINYIGDSSKNAKRPNSGVKPAMISRHFLYKEQIRIVNDNNLNFRNWVEPSTYPKLLDTEWLHNNNHSNNIH